jgi:uncharacterized protein (DUF305 family)
MKLNLRSKSSIVLAVVTTASVLTACSSTNNAAPVDSQSSNSTMGNGMMGNQSTLSAADTMFLQMMIPHHKQAVEMSKLAATNTKNIDVLDLAARIEAAQQPEISLMQKLLADAGMPEMMDHSMGMNGMMSDTEMSALNTSTGTDFDKLYLAGMIKHHQGALDMTKPILNSENAEVKALAESIVTGQTKEIAEMSKLLAAVS